MFYSDDSYMQDLYFYNQMPNNTYNPYMNPNMMQNNMAFNNMNNGMYNTQNLSNLYPSIYRIMMPVISKVVSNSNFQFLNEDVLNNMVDTVFNIVDGQIEYDDTNEKNMSNENNNSSRQVDTKSNTQNNSNSRSNRNDNLLRDIIKILILKELLSRNRMNQQTPQFNQNQYYPVMNCQM